MHIAICDDNIAERKQTERLIKREADRMISEGGTLYMDSYGSAEELSKTPMVYNLFIIDVRHTEGVSSLDVINTLREKGVTAPTCVVYLREDEASLMPKRSDYPEDTLFLAKPVRPEELHDLIHKVSLMVKEAVGNIELRNEAETRYISEKEFIYAEQNGLNTMVTLTDGRSMNVRGNPVALFEEITKGHACFVMPSESSILNIDHIHHFKMRKAFLADGKCFKIDRHVMPYVTAYQNGTL